MVRLANNLGRDRRNVVKIVRQMEEAGIIRRAGLYGNRGVKIWELMPWLPEMRDGQIAGWNIDHPAFRRPVDPEPAAPK